MKIVLLTVGKTNHPYIKVGIEEFQKRLKHYIPFEIVELADLKNSHQLSKTQLQTKEWELVKKELQATDYIFLLDEHGKEYSSEEFSSKLQSVLLCGKKRLIFVIGGAFGFSAEALQEIGEKLAISKMTFTHQMVRLIFVEQLYRAFTILRNEHYHHE